MKRTLILLLFIAYCLPVYAQTTLIGTYKDLAGAYNGHLLTAVLDLTTKTRYDLDTVHGATTVLAGETTYDPINRIYYSYTTALNSGAISGVDSTGHVVSSTVVLGNFNNIEYDINTGKLLGVHRHANNKLTFASLDISTGVITDFDTIKPNTSQGCAAYDPYNAQYFLTTVAGVIRIDVSSGTVVDTLAPASSSTFSNFEYDPLSNSLVGLTVTPAKQVIFSMLDVLTKTLTRYDTMKGSTTWLFSENSYNPVTRTYYSAPSATHVTTVDVATGLVTDTVSTSRPYFIYGMEASYHLPYYSMSLHPLSQTITTGSNVQFTVGTTATSPTYQWQVSTSTGFRNISNGGVYNGATSSILSLTGASLTESGNSYRCLITSGGFTWPSKLAKLEVISGVNATAINKRQRVVVAPNPVTDQLSISILDKWMETSYSLYDQTGNRIKSGSISGSQTFVNLSELPSGYYMLRVGDEAIHSFSILKQ
jgi:hypothetical protein